jgi:hypothetical protein
MKYGFVLLLLAGCTPAVQVNHEVPQLDALSQGVKRLVVENCKPKPRPTLAMPAIPQDVVIDIHGDKIVVNEGGRIVLENFVKARELLK